MKKYEQVDNRVDNYVTFPRKFESYRVYKPIIEFLLAVFFYLVAATLLVVISSVYGDTSFSDIGGGYDNMDAFTVSGAIVSLGGIAIMIPILMLVLKITKSRPFSSLSSSRGGWNGEILKKCLPIAFIVNGVPNIIATLVDGYHGEVKFTVVGFIVCMILVPLQCIAEEYFFRGFVMQTLGSWFKIPAIAIIGQALLFAALHPYNGYGVAVILIDGIGMGIIAYMTNGLEASSALHIVNNMLSFLFAGFGMSRITADVAFAAVPFGLCIMVVYILILAAFGGLLGWFEPRKQPARSE